MPGAQVKIQVQAGWLAGGGASSHVRAPLALALSLPQLSALCEPGGLFGSSWSGKGQGPVRVVVVPDDSRQHHKEKVAKWRDVVPDEHIMGNFAHGRRPEHGRLAKAQ